MLQKQKKKKLFLVEAQSGGTAKYTDCISTKE